MQIFKTGKEIELSLSDAKLVWPVIAGLASDPCLITPNIKMTGAITNDPEDI